MFESICVGRPGGEIDSRMLGFIADCLLFYDRVFVVVNHKGFESLARVCGPDTLWGLLADGPLQVIYQENRLGIATEKLSGTDYHSFIGFHGKGYTAQDFVVKTVQDLVGKSGAGRRIGTRICDRIIKRHFDPKQAFDWVEQVSNNGDSDYLVRELLRELAPGYHLHNARFRVCREGDRYTIDSSVDFELADSAYRAISTDDSHLTPALILSHLYEGHANLTAAAETASEVGADPLESLLARAQIEACVRRTQTGEATIQLFQDVVLDTRSVGEAIASGQRNFDDLRRLIEEADKFRVWVRKQPADSDLLKEYAKACSTISWADKLPNKARRFFLFNAVGTALSLTLDPLTGAAVGLGLNAADTFLFDKLVSGWKPSQFVAGPLASFVTQDS